MIGTDVAGTHINIYPGSFPWISVHQRWDKFTFPKHNNMYASNPCTFQRLQYIIRWWVRKSPSSPSPSPSRQLSWLGNPNQPGSITCSFPKSTINPPWISGGIISMACHIFLSPSRRVEQDGNQDLSGTARGQLIYSSSLLSWILTIKHGSVIYLDISGDFTELVKPWSLEINDKHDDTHLAIKHGDFPASKPLKTGSLGYIAKIFVIYHGMYRNQMRISIMWLGNSGPFAPTTAASIRHPGMVVYAGDWSIETEIHQKIWGSDRSLTTFYNAISRIGGTF